MCAVPEFRPALFPSPGLLSTPAKVSLVMGHTANCQTRSLWGWTLSLDRAHWLSSGLVSLSRGLNDAPKIWALAMPLFLLPATSQGVTHSAAVFLVAVAMGLGSWLAGRRVTTVLAEKVARLDPQTGFAANLTTAVLVVGASRFGLPVSTTHVSSGAIVGVGLSSGHRAVNWRLLGEMAAAWLVTMPVAGLVAMACYGLLR